MIKAVILDVDGTLMDTNYLHVEAWAQAFKAEGYQVPRAEIHRQIGKGSRALIAVFVQDEAVAPRIDELHSEFYAELQQRGYPLPGARELIVALAEQRREVWFATSAKPKELEHHLKMLQADDALAGVVSSKDVENPKPAPDIFRLALKKAGCSPEEAIAVGDTVWDIEAARGAGLSWMKRALLRYTRIAPVCWRQGSRSCSRWRALMAQEQIKPYLYESRE